MKISKQKIKEYTGLLFSLILVFGIMYFITGCPIKLFTGVSCAGCGMTRAYFHLLRFDFAGAFHYHPLFVLPIVFVIVFISEKLGFSRKWAKAIYTVMIIAFLAVYVLRMIDPNNNIVVFEPQNGLIFKGIKYIFELIRQ